MKSLTTKPGEFRATCRKGMWVLEQDAPSGWNLDAAPSRWDKKQEAAVFLVPCTLDTTDRVEFETHMKTHHDGGLFAWEGAGLKPFPPSRKTYGERFPIKLRTGPVKGLADGRPFKPSTKDLARSVETCPSCGLVAEHDGSTVTELWWTEHQRGCALAQQAAS